jgi:outer membrane protein OmpA-like peptidoglycan-associated protein
MKWNLAGLLAALLVVEMHAPPADACGIKLVIKTQTPRKAVARSSHPSHVLLLGTPPHRLERELSAAGHDVEVAPNLAAAKQGSYTVVVAPDAQAADEAKAKYPGAEVIVRSGDVTADIGSVEGKVARRPVRTGETPPVVASREPRTPIAVGPKQPTPVGAKGPDSTEPPAVREAPPAPVREPPPAPPQPTVAVTPRPPPETPAPRPAPPPPVAAPPVAPRTVAREGSLRDEVYFGYNSANFGSRHAALDRAVRYLTKETDLHVVIEGHADPTGTHEGNMKLGQSRAESVRDYLVAAGIDESRLEVISYGDTRLKYGRTDGRNRRVAFVPKK